MISKIRSFVFAAFCLGFSFIANATTIVDTGLVDANQGLAIANSKMNYQPVVASAFSVTDSFRITDVSSYFWTLKSGSLTASIYEDKFGLPSNELYSQSFSIISDHFVKTWSGLSGLDWLVSSGNYWIVYKVLDGQTFEGALGLSAFGNSKTLVSPLNNNVWTSFDANTDGSNTISLIVLGNSVTQVPEPATYIMILMGIVVTGFIVLRNKT